MNIREEKAYQLLRANTEKYLTLKDEEFDYYFSLLQYKIFPKKSFLLRQGEVCDFEGYIIEGGVAGIHENGEGNQTVVSLMMDDWWVTDIGGWVREEPSYLTFQAMLETSMLLIDRERKEQLYRELPVFERLFRMMGQIKIGAQQRRLVNCLSLTGGELYHQLIAQYPLIEQKFPQYLIASYLGISPEFLSKIRRNMTK